MLDTLTHDDFLAHLDQSFRINPGDEEGFEASLVEVSQLGEDSSETSRRGFSLVFRGPKDRLFNQQICRVEHSELGQLDLFLVPIGPDAEGMCFEAVFN